MGVSGGWGSVGRDVGAGVGVTTVGDAVGTAEMDDRGTAQPETVIHRMKRAIPRRANVPR